MSESEERPCADSECSNLARPGRPLCHACDMRRRRGSKCRRPRFPSPFERLVAAALKFAEAAGEAEYLQAENTLRKAALWYATAPTARRAKRVQEATPP